MKTNYLFPHQFKLISGILFMFSSAGFITLFVSEALEPYNFKMKVFTIVDSVFQEPTRYFTFVENDVLDELLAVVILVSGVIFAFSKEKQEDEMVASIRLNSLAWATIANYSILLFCYLFIYGFPFLNVLMGAMFSQLVIFIVLFRYKMYRFYNSRQDEE